MVQRWLNADTGRGLDGLRPRKAPGARPKLTAHLAPVLRRRVIGGPAEQGLDRANRTYAELADHLLKAEGVWVGTPAMQAFEARHGIRPYRPTYRLLRGDSANQATAPDELAARKSDCVPCQGLAAIFSAAAARHGWPVRTMALAIISSFRATAVRITLARFPRLPPLYYST